MIDEIVTAMPGTDLAESGAGTGKATASRTPPDGADW